MGFNLFFCQGTGIQLFLFVKDLGNLLFSVSRLWKISLFDCQVLWVQYSILYVYPLSSTLKYKDTTSYASSYDYGKRNKDRKKKNKKRKREKRKVTLLMAKKHAKVRHRF